MENKEEEKDYCDYTFEEVLNDEGFSIKDMKQFEAFEIAEKLKNSNIAEITHWILNPNLNYYHLEDSEFIKIIGYSLTDEEDKEERWSDYFSYTAFNLEDQLKYYKEIYKEELIEDWKEGKMRRKYEGKFTNFNTIKR